MNNRTKESKKLERAHRMSIWMADKGSRNKTILDKVCRLVLNRATKMKPEEDFMRDGLVDNDVGFDPDELERFQRGENY
ncbi:MAG: hypothetical protein Pars2KO_10940 [Parasphingorhabdus sp.]